MVKIHFYIPIPTFIESIFVYFLLRYRKKIYGYPFRKIKLTQGLYAIIDPEDYEQLNIHKWYAVRAGQTFYAVRSIYIERPRANSTKRKMRTTVKMHRQIMRPDKDLVVDHINHNGLDNRRKNLRCVTTEENNRNRIFKGSSQYIGVHWCEDRKKWRVRIYINGIKVHIGYYDSEIEAAKAYDEAARKYRGEFAVLNFGEPPRHEDTKKKYII